MKTDDPVILTRLPNEAIASLLVARLRDSGIRTEMSGVYTSAFRAEAPGEVQILVLSHGLNRARAVLAYWQRSNQR